MGEPELEEKIKVLSAKFDSLFLGFKLFFLLVLLFVLIGNLLAALSIERYQRLFIEGLGPDHPLPSVTLLVIAGKTVIPVLAFVWLAIGILAAFIRRYVVLSMLLFCAAFLASILQCAIVYVAMQLPLISIINGMSDVH